jgi:DNA polymerase II large subunit
MKSLEMNQHGRPRCRQKDDIKIELKEIRREDVDSIYLADNLDHLCPLVENIINLLVPQDEKNVQLSMELVGFKANTLYRAFI